VTIIGIPCRNRSAFTLRTVRALAAFNDRDSYTLACINDTSEDDTADVLYRLQCEGLVDYVIDHGTRQGVSASVNDAWRIGEQDATAFVKLDNDTECLRPGLLAQLASVAEAFRVGIVAPQVVPGRLGKTVRTGDLVARRPNSNLNGALLYVTREAFNRIGYFYEWPQPYGYADAEYCFRCRKAGLDTLYLPEPPGHWVTHLEDGDRAYRRWKTKLRSKHLRDWRAFQANLKRGRIETRQPFKITGER
jgi:GT2 family glycosyltransferase